MPATDAQPIAQPVPPPWRELGKSVSDLLVKDYLVRGISFEVKTLPTTVSTASTQTLADPGTKTLRESSTKNSAKTSTKSSAKTSSKNSSTPSVKPVTLKVTGNRDNKSAAITGDIEGKYVNSKNGITLTQTWKTTSILVTKVECENQLAKGSKFDLATTLNPAKAQGSVNVIATYKLPSLHMQATADSLKA